MPTLRRSVCIRVTNSQQLSKRPYAKVLMKAHRGAGRPPDSPTPTTQQETFRMSHSMISDLKTFSLTFTFFAPWREESKFKSISLSELPCFFGQFFTSSKASLFGLIRWTLHVRTLQFFFATFWQAVAATQAFLFSSPSRRSDFYPSQKNLDFSCQKKVPNLQQTKP